ncbi:sigma-70 family RNA polymerase sigma factor, partial [Solirubrobacter deserti]
MTALAESRYRRQRADAIVAQDYERLKPEVLSTLRGKLAARGLRLDDADLEASYNQAWHGVYTRLAAGEPIANRAGLVITIAERRALDEVRALHPDRRAAVDDVELPMVEPDLAERLDDHVRLGQFVEGLRERLTVREQQAAALCYVHAYTRRDAARVLGVSPRRMEKLMDGVSKKLGDLLGEIERGEWCDRRESLIRAYALGLLDTGGERRRLAAQHLEDCSACRYRVLRMRGLAAVTPPAAAVVAARRGGGSGAAPGPRDRPRPARRARQAGLAAAPAGAVAVTAFAGVRLFDRPPGHSAPEPPGAAVTSGTPGAGAGQAAADRRGLTRPAISPPAGAPSTGEKRATRSGEAAEHDRARPGRAARARTASRAASEARRAKRQRRNAARSRAARQRAAAPAAAAPPALVASPTAPPPVAPAARPPPG